MKATVMAAAALLGGASAHNHQRHAHEAFHKRGQNDTVEMPADVCSEVVQTITGDFVWVPTPDAVPAHPNTTSAVPTTAPATTAPAVVPTPAVQTCPTPGTYTFPATTVTVNETTTVVVPSITTCTPGTHTLGGVVTVVETATTVVCPYATVSTGDGGYVMSIIESTTYVCPSAGTYTVVPPTTTTVTAYEIVNVPSITSYPPGTYTAPALTTVVETATVIYCPFSSADATTSSTSSIAPTTTTPAPVDAILSSVASVVTAAIPSVATTVASSSASASSTSSPILGGSTGSAWSLTYTPYHPTTGNCQTAEAVDADVAAIAAAGFTSLRVYSTDCDTLPNVGAAARKYGLKMIVGIFIGTTGCSNASPDVETQISAFQAWAQWDLVELFSVANEAIANGYCTAQELVDLISHVKSELSAYTGPYTTTDVVSSWQQTDVASLLCAAVDHPSANVHSYFTSSVSPSDAGAFVKSQLEIVEAACGGVTGYVLESGYPTAGATIGLNIPSIANQALAITSIIDTIGDRVVLFSMFDDKWKAAGQYGCEQSWGIVPSLFGTLGDAWATLAAAL